MCLRKSGTVDEGGIVRGDFAGAVVPAIVPPGRPFRRAATYAGAACAYLVLSAVAIWAQSGTIHVQARDAVSRAPLPNVELKLRRSAPPATEWPARTDADGKAQFEALAPGRYFLQWHLPGY